MVLEPAAPGYSLPRTLWAGAWTSWVSRQSSTTTFQPRPTIMCTGLGAQAERVVPVSASCSAVSILMPGLFLLSPSAFLLSPQGLNHGTPVQERIS